MDKIYEILNQLMGNALFEVVSIAIMLDTLLGCMRAIKEKKFNSCFGIDGAIRKVSMLVCLIALWFIDSIVHINVMSFIPQSVLEVIKISKVGLCEFFSLLFIAYEIISILKNLTLCGVWLPKKLKEAIQKWLTEMTGEIPGGTDIRSGE